MKNINFDKQEIDYLKKLLKDDKSKIAEKIYKRLNKNKIKPSSAKAKGRDFQYWVCQKIGDTFGVKFVQSDDNCLIHSREMGQHGVDIVLRGFVAEKFPYSIECKNCETLSIPQWLEQAKNNKGDKDYLLIIKKKSLKEPIVILDFESFLKLFK